MKILSCKTEKISNKQNKSSAKFTSHIEISLYVQHSVFLIVVQVSFPVSIQYLPKQNHSEEARTLKYNYNLRRITFKVLVILRNEAFNQSLVFYCRFVPQLLTFFTGILPLYFWIGNPFCWSCYPLRFLIAAPAGLGFMVMVLAPCMGIAKLRVMVEVPDLAGTVGAPSDIIFMIGLVFWVILIVGFLAYKIFYSFIMELCPCLAWCEDDDKKKKDAKEEKTTGCLCFQ